MVRKLVAYSVTTALAEPKHYWLSDVFEKGFTGYRNLSRSQLAQELQMRGLEESDGAGGEELEEDAACDDLPDGEALDCGGLDLDEYDPDITLPLRPSRVD